jgi:GNAT superfamily N-acetyltransferase
LSIAATAAAGRAQLRPPALRRATAGDARFIAEMIDLSNAGGDRAAFDQAIANVLVPGSDVGFEKAVIVEAGGEPAGAMVLNPPPPAPVDLSAVAPVHRPFEELKAHAGELLYLRNIAILPRHQGRGLASILAGLAVEMARLAGMSGLCAVVHRRNDAMRALMASRGLAVRKSGFLPSHPQFPQGVEIDLWTLRFQD